MSESILSTATDSGGNEANIHVACGENGVGKTTWAAGFPNALIIDIEKGARQVVKKTKAKRILHEGPVDLATVRKVIAEMKSDKHPYETLVIDSAEALEGLINVAVCAEGNVDSIEKYEGGYGKGFTRSREIMREIMLDLQDLRDNYGITTIIIAHTQTKSQTNAATNQTYDRVIMRCNDKMAAIIRDLADNVFYISYKVLTTSEKGKTKAFGDGQRVMYTQWRPGFDAKNRLELPHELPLSYDAFVEACEAKPEANCDDLLAEIKAMSEKVDDKMQKSVADMLSKYKTNPTKLKEVKTRLMKYVAA